MKKIFLLSLIVILLTSCATTGEIRVRNCDKDSWIAYSGNHLDFQGTFVTVDYSGVKTVGVKLEEPLGSGWKKIGVKEGDIWMGMADLAFFKAEDWKKAWSVVRTRLQQEKINVGILKSIGPTDSYEKEITWECLNRK